VPVPQAPPKINSNPPKARPSASSQGSRPTVEPGQSQPNGSPAVGYPGPQLPSLPPGTTNAAAQQRAARDLDLKYGPRAAAQVTQLRQSSSQRQQPGLPHPQFPEGEDHKLPGSSYSPPVPQPNSSLQAAQRDGGNDSLAEWKAEVARRRHLEGGAPGAGDRLFREHMRQRQQEIEGGGLMMPLDERYISSAGNKCRVEAVFGTGGQQPCDQAIPSSPKTLLKSQGDGQGDDDDEDKEPPDEDAINSDLDDPNDTGGDPEDDNSEQVMLCTYDKVQRVKNKWKCTMKDGILRITDKE
jgi:transcription initiation factor TFIIA large subunit